MNIRCFECGLPHEDNSGFCEGCTKPIIKPICLHDDVFLGSGGYYIFCQKCYARWVAVANTDDDKDYDRPRQSGQQSDSHRIRPDDKPKDITSPIVPTTNFKGTCPSCRKVCGNVLDCPFCGYEFG